MKRLDYVYWLGGSACAGKTTVARRLAASHGLAVYHCDEHFEEHRRRADPARHPRFVGLMDRPPKELWRRPAPELAAELAGFYEDELEMVLEDLAALPDAPTLVEGAGLLPTGLRARLGDLHQAVWLVSTGELRRRLYPRRGAWVRELIARCDDGDGAWERWMARDDLHACAVADATRRLGGHVVEVDGRRGPEEIAVEVARHLGLGEAPEA